jgi:heterodisulfide reductase subunit A-like polyferredoxin
MTVALNLAEQNFETVLMEKENALGGHARRVYFTLSGAEVQPLLSDLIRQVENHKKIAVLKNAQLIDHSGFMGNFTTKVSVDGTEQEIQHGVTIVASGGVEYQPKEYLYAEHPAVLTQGAFHEMLAVNPEKFTSTKEVVMIQCVGSRDVEHPYCSRICCQAAVMNALKLKALNPDVNIYILYRDMRTFGFSEKYYKQAREKGIQCIRYDAENKPEVIGGERLIVRSLDPSLGATIEFHPDFLILSAAIRPHPGSQQIATICRLPEDVDGFFMEAHVKLRPLDFATSGVFLCGLAHGPKDIEESITEAKGAAARAATILSKKEMMVGGSVATVIPELCAACLTCVRTCPFNVPIMNEEEGVIEIDPAACQGCGNCASACPRKAITVGHYRDDQMVALITAQLKRENMV